MAEDERSAPSGDGVAATVGARHHGAPFAIGTTGAGADGGVSPLLGALVAELGALRPVDGATVAKIEWDQTGVASATTGHLEGFVTRWECDPGRKTAHINQDVRLVSEDGSMLGRATVRWRAEGDGAVNGGAVSAALDVASVPWIEWLAGRLAVSEAFASSTGTFDGTIGIASGDREAHLRIYRGKVIEAGRRSINGATFTLHAPERTWVELLTAPRNDFVLRTMRGEFRTSGSGFQYLRMIKALMAMFDAAQAGVKEAQGA